MAELEGLLGVPVLADARLSELPLFQTGLVADVVGRAEGEAVLSEGMGRVAAVMTGLMEWRLGKGCLLLLTNYTTLSETLVDALGKSLVKLMPRYA